jgi:catechol 2,3-dioxygenase-like lactoylglutathione lyase family enzyme
MAAQLTGEADAGPRADDATLCRAAKQAAQVIGCEGHDQGENMPHITQLGRVIVPVSDQDEAIAFYTEKLGFSLAADISYGDGQRWVEVTPPGGGAAIALTPPQGEYQPGRMTGIALGSSDPRADQAELRDKGVDVDAELMGGDGTVPLLFFFRDQDRNQLMLVQAS